MERAYRSYQSMMLRDKADGGLEKKGQIRDKNLQLFTFVVRRRNEVPDRPPWQQLMKDWNETKDRPGKPYTSYRQFSDDYRDTEMRLRNDRRFSKIYQEFYARLDAP